MPRETDRIRTQERKVKEVMAVSATAVARERTVREAEKLIRTICLYAQPMTRETFAPYGEIISERGGVELDLDGGQPCAVMQTVEARPLAFDFLGRHRRTEQVFAPLGGAQSIIAVALPSAENEDL